MKRALQRNITAMLTVTLWASACGGLEETELPAPADPTLGSAEQAITAVQGTAQQDHPAAATKNRPQTGVQERIDPEANPVYRDEFGDCQAGPPGTGTYLIEIVKCLSYCGGLPCGLDDGNGGCMLGCYCGGGVDCDPYDDGNDGDVGGGKNAPAEVLGM